MVNSVAMYETQVTQKSLSNQILNSYPQEPHIILLVLSVKVHELRPQYTFDKVLLLHLFTKG